MDRGAGLAQRLASRMRQRSPKAVHRSSRLTSLAGRPCAAGERYAASTPRRARSSVCTKSPFQNTSARGWALSAMSRCASPVVLLASTS